MEVVEKLHDGAAQKMEIKQPVESNLAFYYGALPWRPHTKANHPLFERDKSGP
jgi:hypothetical protein